MTVINMMSFGNAGAAVADEQSSTLNRKYNVSQKLRELHDGVIYGGSGPSDFIHDIYGLIKTKIKEETEKRGGPLSLRDVYSIANDETLSYKNGFKNNFLRARIGFGLDDLLVGKLIRSGGIPLDDAAKSSAVNLLGNIDEQIAMGFLIGGKENGKFEIYQVNNLGTGIKCSRPYASIGSGSDESERILSSYVEKLGREDRESIPEDVGLTKLIEATNASSNLNLGVGGTPLIAYVGSNEVFYPNENSCILATEIVQGLTGDFLDKDFVYDAIRRLIIEGSNSQQIDDEMMGQVSDKDRFIKLLRGYKV